MKKPIDVLSRLRFDSDGRQLLGNPEQGCRHCGYVAAKYAEPERRVILYHPGCECCEGAIRDQIRFRESEIASIQRRVHELEQSRDLILEEAGLYSPDSRAAEATRAHRTAERARQTYASAVAVHGHTIADLRQEIARLEGLLASRERSR